MCALMVGMAADTLNVMDVVQTRLFGRQPDELIEARYRPEDIAIARQAQFVRRYVEHCSGQEVRDGTVEAQTGLQIDIFHCGNSFLAARVTDDKSGFATMSEIVVPVPVSTVASAPRPARPAAARAEGVPLAQNALPLPPAPIVRSMCMRDEASKLIIRYYLGNGTCMDESVDKRSGAVTERVLNVPCDCTGFDR